MKYSQGLEARSHVMSLKPRAQVYPPDIIVSSRRCRGIRGAGVGGANMSGARSLSTRRAVEMHNASSRMERIFFRAGFPFSSLAPSSSPGVQGVSLLHTLVVEPCNALSTFFTCTEYRLNIRFSGDQGSPMLCSPCRHIPRKGHFLALLLTTML